ncbi:MAG: alpha/beta hydrolase, partial [Gammaproteobacteria bacterium]|nr:alpha/beta hydrolase [Gammaproteobacteria bacterium]
MKYRSFFTLVVLMWLLPLNAHAQVLVLLQGYLGPGSSWRASGVTHILDRADWVDGGHLRIENDKVVNYRKQFGQDRTFYTLKMPTEAPVMVQAKLLAKYMKDIGKQHPGESLNIAGFSAGGIIGRTYMVMRKDDEPKVATLITISTPHLGTHLAEVGSKIRRSPLSSFTPFIGAGSFDRSDALLKDMHPEEYGNFLYWLNRQTHPRARYVSVIKGGRSFIGGDFVVPAYSQNMNNVVALWGMSTTVRLTGTHMLSHVDALLLVQQMLIGQQI